MSDLKSALLDVINHAQLPLTLTATVKALRVSVGTKLAKKERVLAELEALTQAGNIRVYQLNPRKPAEASYSSLHEAELAARLLEAHVRTAKKPVKVPDLRKKLPPALQSLFDQTLEELLARRQLYLLPKATPLVQAHPPSARDLIDTATLRRLRLLVQQVNQVRQEPVTLEALMDWLDGPEKTARGSVETQAPAMINAAPLTPSLLREWHEADALRSSTRMIPIPLTWARYTDWAGRHGAVSDRQELRRMLEMLYNAGQIWLEPCECPQNLPEAERALLVPLAIGPPGYSWCWAK